MKNYENILIVGGDSRQKHLAWLLTNDFNVYTLGLRFDSQTSQNAHMLSSYKDVCEHMDYIILPMPVTTDNICINSLFSKTPIHIDDVLSIADANTHVLGGKIDGSVAQKLAQKNLSYTDYLKREELAVMNAIPTAEGALGIAMQETATTIFGTKCLIVGYGRISKVLSRLLLSMGAKVTISARNYKDLAWIRASGATAIETEKIVDVIASQALVFNTVPAQILGEDVLRRVEKDCVLIDLASKPGGIDFEIA
ncbi:MAG: dipicolinate synthase subunit DpsA, partial [Oscillospiraceae bacterium]